MKVPSEIVNDVAMLTGLSRWASYPHQSALMLQIQDFANAIATLYCENDAAMQEIYSIRKESAKLREQLAASYTLVAQRNIEIASEYQLGRQHQMESDAELCNSDMELALRTGQDGIAFAFRMYREGILNNTGDLK